MITNEKLGLQNNTSSLKLGIYYDDNKNFVELIGRK